MSNDGITIVVKGNDGLGRTQVVEIVKQALYDKGFADVNVIDPPMIDLKAGTQSVREVPVVIMES